MPGAGKTVVTRILSSIADKVVSMGDIVREEARRRGIGKDSASMMKFAKQLRIEGGGAVVAKLVLEKLRNDKGLFLIDGIRSLDEIELFRRYGQVVIVAVHASPYERFRRLRNRGRPGDPKVWEEFVERDLEELRLGIGNVIALADVMVVNEGVNLNNLSQEIIEKVRVALSHDKDKG
jgi:dephospho-CoA kinase